MYAYFHPSYKGTKVYLICTQSSKRSVQKRPAAESFTSWERIIKLRSFLGTQGPSAWFWMGFIMFFSCLKTSS